jgi:lysophospholipase L1-like esterase
MQQRKTRQAYYSSIQNNNDETDTDEEDASFQNFPQQRTTRSNRRTVNPPLQQETITLDNLTSNKARNNMLITITNTQGGNKQSRSGFYYPPTFQQTLRKYRFKIVFGFIGILIVILTIQHGGAYGHRSPRGNNINNNSSASGNEMNDNWNDSTNDEDSIPDLNVDLSRPQNIPLCRPIKSGNNIIGSIFDKSNPCTCPDPLIPSPGPYTNWDEAQKTIVQSIDPSMHYDIVFVGDSITNYWNKRITTNGEKPTTALEQTFPDSNVLALGIPGDTVGSLLYRLKIQELDIIGKDLSKNGGRGGVTLIWILIGTNDLSFGCSDERIYAGIVNYLEELTKVVGKSGMSGATIVINGILPRTSRKDGILSMYDRRNIRSNDNTLDSDDGISHYSNGNNQEDKDPNAPELEDDDANTVNESQNMDTEEPFHYWPSIRRINKALKIYASKHENIEYYDANQVFIGHVGNNYFHRKNEFLMKELQYDYVHPTTLGYTFWGRDIQDYIASDLDVPESLKDFNS